MKKSEEVKAQAREYEKEILKQLGVFIFKKRRERGVIIKDLNIMTGVGTAVISDLENKKSMPRIETLLRICEVLEISTSELFDRMKLGTVNRENNSKLVIDDTIDKYDRLSSILAGLDYPKEEVADIVSYAKFIDFRKKQDK